MIWWVVLLFASCGAIAEPIDASIDAAIVDASSARCACDTDGGAGCDPETEICVASVHSHTGTDRHVEYACAPIPPDCLASGDCSCIQAGLCTCTPGPLCWSVTCIAP